jgi:multiple sugar transport system permease protein
MSKKKSIYVRYIVLTILMIVVIFPFIWLLLSSFKAESDILNYPPKLFAPSYTIEQYKKVITTIPILSYTKNTAIFAGSVAVISVFIDAMAGYAFARIQFKGAKVLFNIILLTMMIPFQILMIPLFIEIFKMGLLNTYSGLILPRLASAFGIFMMRSFFVTLPKDLEEAARIDGLNEFGIFYKIMLPLCIPAMLTLGILHLMNNWNDLLYPLILTTTTEMRTLSAGLAMFVGERVTEYGPIMAATVISITPLMLLYVFAQKYFVQGIAMSGMKS